MKEETISILEIIYVIKSKWRIITITTLIAAIIASVFSLILISPVYSSSLRLFIGKDNLEKSYYNSSDILLYQNLAKTYSQLIPTEDLIQKAISVNNLDVNVDEVVSGLDVTNNKESQIISITYKSKDLVLTKTVLDAVAKEFIKESQACVPNGNVKVIERAKYPIYPDNFNSIRNISIGTFGGFFIGIIIVLMVEYIRGTVKDKDQIELSVGLPVIGLIPCNTRVY